MWPSATSPPVITKTEVFPCHEAPPSARFSTSPPPMVDVEEYAGHGSGQHVRPGSYWNAPPSLHHAAGDYVSTGRSLAGLGLGKCVRPGPLADSYIGAPPGLRQATKEHEMREAWLAGVCFGLGVRQGFHADSYIGAPPGLHQATKEHEMGESWLAGVRQGSHAGSYIGAPPGMHQATEKHEMTENWLARRGSGQGVRHESHAESYFAAPPGLRHPAERERKENWLAHAGAVPPTPRTDDSMPVTTLMIDNVHRRLTQEEVLGLLPCDRFNYDMLYVRFDLTRKRPSGRMFINFTSHHYAAEFQAQWHGKQDAVLSATDARGDRKPLSVQAAGRQGLELNVANWQRHLRQDAPVTTFPALFIEGNRVYFWEYRTSLSCMQ